MHFGNSLVIDLLFNKEFGNYAHNLTTLVEYCVCQYAH